MALDRYEGMLARDTWLSCSLEPVHIKLNEANDIYWLQELEREQ